MTRAPGFAEKTRAAWARDPARQARLRAGIARRFAEPAYCAAWAESVRARWRDPAFRARVAAGQRRAAEAGRMSPNWALAARHDLAYAMWRAGATYNEILAAFQWPASRRAALANAMARRAERHGHPPRPNLGKHAPPALAAIIRTFSPAEREIYRLGIAKRLGMAGAVSLVLRDRARRHGPDATPTRRRPSGEIRAAANVPAPFHVKQSAGEVGP